MPRTDFVSLVGALIVSSLTPPLYAADKFPDYPVRAPSDYVIKAERSGVAIGAQPVEDPRDQKTYFDTELTPKGFIPVFIVIHNGSSDTSFLFDQTNIGYAGVANNGVPTVGNTKVQENILKKAVKSKTLSPGTSVSGFVYVPVPKKGPRERIHLQVPITKAGTSETFVLNLFL